MKMLEPGDTSGELPGEDFVSAFATPQPDLGGWLFGAAGGDLTPAGPVLGETSDGYEGNLVVGTAVVTLIQFGGPLTRTQARALLPMWCHFDELTGPDVVAILRRFPSASGR